MRRLLFVLVVSLCACPAAGRAQPNPARTDSADLEDTLERLLDEQPGAQRSDLLVERLTKLAQSPLDINAASAADLSTLPTLSPLVARRIVKDRAANGPFSSVNDLSRVNGITTARLRTLRPYLVARVQKTEGPSPPPLSFRTITTDLDVEVLQRFTRELDLGRGYTDSTFRGSPPRLTTRIRLHHDRRVQLAITLDKDPGEAFRWEPATDTYGFDHIAGHLALRNMGRLETLVLGDFTAEFGQGLALWQGLTFGKGRDPVSPVVREGRGLVPFASTSENRAFRGLAARVAVTPTVSVSGFASRRRRDATLDSSAVEPEAEGPIPARTLSTGGLHRTASELARKNTFRLSTVGGAVEYQSGSLRAGVVGYHNWFGRPLRPGTRPYRRFDVSGTRSAMASVYATGYVGDYVVFGEAARTPGGAVGALAGAALDHRAGVEAVLLARRYPRAFGGLYGGAFSESGGPRNEFGVYTGLRLRVAEDWWVAGYVDQYRFPWLRFGVPRPSSGLDTRLLVETEPRPWLSSYLQFRAARDPAGTDRTGPAGRQLAGVQREWRHSLRWHAEYAFSDRLTLRTRLEGTRVRVGEQSPSHGLLLYQGVGIQVTPSLELDARLALFDTDGFPSRVYAYERDLLYSFSVPALFGRGQRSYALARYSPIPPLTLEAKYGVTWYPNRDTIGSGLGATDGPRVREVRFQLRWSL